MPETITLTLDRQLAADFLISRLEQGVRARDRSKAETWIKELVAAELEKSEPESSGGGVTLPPLRRVADEGRPARVPAAAGGDGMTNPTIEEEA